MPVSSGSKEAHHKSGRICGNAHFSDFLAGNHRKVFTVYGKDLVLIVVLFYFADKYPDVVVRIMPYSFNAVERSPLTTGYCLV